MSRLPREDFVPHAPANTGDEVHVHHCRQGRNNDRLYIRRNDDGSIIAYCHHCGLSGYHNPTRGRLSDLVARHNGGKVDRSGVRSTDLTLPPDSTGDVKRWPLAAQRWVKQYGITDEEIKDAGLVYSFHRGRVIIPTYGEEGKLLSWQGRSIDGQTDRSPYEQELISSGKRQSVPKYDTKVASGTTKGSLLKCIVPRRLLDASHPLYNTSPALVITEDKISAIKCARFQDALAMQGASAKLKDLTHLKNYGIIYIWLDNDNNQVKQSQTRLKRALELFCPDVRVIHTDKDPKEHSMAELEELIT